MDQRAPRNTTATGEKHRQRSLPPGSGTARIAPAPSPASAASPSRFALAGFRLHVRADQPAALPAAEKLLGRFRAPRDEGPAWELSITHRDFRVDSTLPPGARRVWSGEVAPGIEGVNSVGPDFRRLELTDLGRLDIDLAAERAELQILPGGARPVVGYFVLSLTMTGLVRAGHSPLHASCLAVEVEGRWRSVLIVAPSMTGKSTTSLALTGGGWKLMGDDIALVTPQAEGLALWGFPRDCHVRRFTRTLLPWLNELPLVASSLPETSLLSIEGLGPRGWNAHPEPLPPLAILCLERPNGEGHRLERIDPAAALIHLAHENVQPIEGREDGVARRDFSRFAQLVRQTPAWRLSVGPQPADLPAFLAPQLGG